MEATKNNGLNNEPDIKILVVDDRDDNLLSIEAILEKDRYNIVKANSGRAALKILLQQHDFSLILMDVQMPEMDGLETANIIYERDKLKAIPIIFITAYSNDEEYLFKGYKMGGVDYIYKPINPELLRVKVGVFVDLYRKNHQLINHEQNLIAANKSLQKEIEQHKISEETVKVLNEQLVKNVEYLKNTNEELDRFAYVASHDLQEPLRKIMVFSDKILHTKSDATEIEKYLTKITNCSQRMQSLIHNLMQFSRHAVTATDFIYTDLNEVVRDVIAELEIEIEKSGALIHIQDLPKLFAIPSLIRQVFYNLISNAIKFRKPGKVPEISIKAKNVTPSTLRFQHKYAEGVAYIKISVEDNGIGFDEKYRDDIFMAFKRLHSYHEIEGTGVGLSICKKNIDKHNGFISAESPLNEGATFIIILPEKQPLH